MIEDAEARLHAYRTLSPAALDSPATPLPESLFANLSALFESSTTTWHEAARITIPGYVIQDVIGRGGMGTVYTAWDEVLQRTVAIKVSDTPASEKTNAQFEREAHAAASVHSDFVVPIYARGQLADRRPYLVMPRIQGVTLRDLLQTGPPQAKRLAEIISQIARGVHALHTAGVLHRDIKPANILLDAVDNRAKLTDFGIARTATAATLTLDGLFAGTPEYMAPEQALADHPLDARTDIFSLGITLFEGLTGRVPLTGSPFDILRVRNTREAISPRSLAPTVPRDLAAVCLKATEREPARRYATAAEFADDLDRWLQGRPTLARNSTWPEHSWRWVKRNPIAVALMTVFLAGAVVSATGWLQAVKNASLADQRLAVAQAATDAETRQRQRAEQHLATARFAIERFRSRITAPGFLTEPKYEVTRQELLGDAANVYERLLEIELADERLHQDAITTAHSLGLLQSQLGRTQEAEATLRRSIQLARTQVANNPSDSNALSALGLSLNTLHVVLVKEEKYLQASDLDVESIDISGKILALNPADRGLRRNLVAMNANRANAFLSRGDSVNAASCLSEALAQIEELLRGQPADYVLLADRARLRFNLGFATEDLTKRAALWQESLDQRQLLLKREKRHFVVVEFVKNGFNLANLLSERGDAKRALQIAQSGIREAREEQSKLSDVTVQKFQAKLLTTVALAHVTLHQPAEAIQPFHDALAIHTELCNLNLQQHWADAMECAVCFLQFNTDQKQGQLPAAIAVRETAQGWLDALRNDFAPGTPTRKLIDEQQKILDSLK